MWSSVTIDVCVALDLCGPSTWSIVASAYAANVPTRLGKSGIDDREPAR